MAGFRSVFLRFVDKAGKPSLPDVDVSIEIGVDDSDELVPTKEVAENLATPAAVSQLLLLNYMDSRGRQTARRVSVKRVDYKGNQAWLRCFCHERQALRTFRVDRIIELTDFETGEVVDDIEGMFRALVGDAVTLPDEKEQHAIGIMRSHSRLVNLLVYFARADGRFSASEKSLIVDFLSAIGNAPTGEEKAILARLVARVFPDDEDFENALSWLDDMPRDDARSIIELVEHLIKVDGKVHPDEADLLEDLVMVVDDWDH